MKSTFQRIHPLVLVSLSKHFLLIPRYKFRAYLALHHLLNVLLNVKERLKAVFGDVRCRPRPLARVHLAGLT